MRPHNSVGGYRIYPSSPEDAEASDSAVAVQAQFREVMDRLNTERQLSERQQSQVDHLDPSSGHAHNHQRLVDVFNRLWQLALEKQQTQGRYDASDLFTTKQLGELLNDYADRWQGFKRQLDENA